MFVRVDLTFYEEEDNYPRPVNMFLNENVSTISANGNKKGLIIGIQAVFIIIIIIIVVSLVAVYVV